MQDNARIGAVKKTEADENENNIVTSETRPNYTQDAPLYTPSGIDAPLLENDRVLLVRTEATGKFAIVGYLGATQGANPGELFLYSRDKDGNTKAVLKLQNDGSIEGIAPESITINTDKDFTLEAKKAANIKGDTVKISGKVTITEGELNCKGLASPNGQGCFCALPFCVVTGATHIGSKASAT